MMGLASKSGKATCSLTLAAVTTALNGTPRSSTSKWSFIPGLARSVGLGPLSFSPQWRTHVGAVAALPLPLDAVLLFIEVQAACPDLLEDAGFLPFGKAVVNGLPGTELFRHIAPSGTGAEDVEHAIEQGAIIGRRSAATMPRRARGNDLLNLKPKVIRNIFRCWHASTLAQSFRFADTL